MTATPWPFAGSDEHAWPDKQTDAGNDQDRYLAMLEVRKKRADQEIARQAAADAFDDELYEAYYTGAIEVAKASLDRAHAAADVVQKAAAAIVTLYTGILAVAFSVTTKPLPFTGVFAAILLGLAIVLSTVFVAYIPSKTIKSKANAAIADAGGVANDFVDWMKVAASVRAYFLRASVLALGCAVFFLPAPFVGAVDVPWHSSHSTTTPSASAVKSTPAWPTLAPQVASYSPQLKRIVYQAQVTEVAALRSPTPTAQKQSSGFWWLSFGVALLLVFIVPFVIGRTVTDPVRA